MEATNILAPFALASKPVTFSELTQSDEFWSGCKSCKNYHILLDNDRERCICTGLVYDNLDDKYAEQAKQNVDKKESE